MFGTAQGVPLLLVRAGAGLLDRLRGSGRRVRRLELATRALLLLGATYFLGSTLWTAWSHDFEEVTMTSEGRTVVLVAIDDAGREVRALVERVEPDAKRKRVRVAFRPDRIGVAEIEDAVTSLGFRVQAAHEEGEVL